MFLSNKLVHEYQKEHKRKYGEDISPKEAEKDLLDLKDLIRLITKERRSRNGS